jgi:hypothetical protein
VPTAIGQKPEEGESRVAAAAVRRVRTFSYGWYWTRSYQLAAVAATTAAEAAASWSRRRLSANTGAFPLVGL